VNLKDDHPFTLSFVVEAENNRICTAQAQSGDLLTQVAYRAGVTIQQTCGGTPSCTDCRIIVKEGADSGFEAAQGPETRLMGNVYFITKERLACQAIVRGPSTVFVPRYERPKAQNSRATRFKGERANGKEESKKDKKNRG
jgi:ferredoxin